MTADRDVAPLVILALDVGDAEAIQEWAREGYLPTIASLMERGCWGRTSGPDLICEHGIWVSLLSGVSRGRHGYYASRQLRPGTYDLVRTTELEADALPFWAHLRGRDVKVAIVDVPDAYPLPGLAGIQLANWAVHNPSRGPSAEPTTVLRDVRRALGPAMRIDERIGSSVREDERIYRRLLERIERKGALSRHLLGQRRFELVVVGFAESHLASHQFWQYRPRADRPGPMAEGALTHAIRDVYRAIDQLLGRLLALLSPDANVFLVASTGMADHYPTTGLIEAFCHRLGYQASPRSGRPSPGGPASNPLAAIRRTVPEAWRLALSRHFPRAIRERLLADQFRGATDWRRTTAFAIPSLYSSFLRVNLRGREPEGTVEAGPAYEALLDRLESDLRRLVDPETGQPAVQQIGRSARLFGDGPPQSLPDLFVTWKPAPYWMRRLAYPNAELTQRKPEHLRGSDHTQHGFVAAAGPSVQRRGPIGEVSPLDLAPTFLRLLGEPLPLGMTGRPIEGLVGSAAMLTDNSTPGEKGVI
ncbi:MAG: alkaline phosphatase family protein [Chloroflexi bacterium]|nr:alkaline phosphatase family protein [Chloroflexota bacterium]